MEKHECDYQYKFGNLECVICGNQTNRIKNIETHTPRCPVCKSENLEAGYSIERRLPSYKQYQLTVCQDCGNVQCNLSEWVEND